MSAKIEEKLKALGFELRKRENPVHDYAIRSLGNITTEDLLKEGNDLIIKKASIFKDPIKNLTDENKYTFFLKFFTIMPEIKLAGKIIRDHVDNNKNILALTDYDCDGANSAYVINKLFKEFKGYNNLRVFINKRKFGNGVNPPLIDYLKTHFINLDDIDLLLTADHGCGSIPYLIELLKQHPKLNIVITDHHEMIHEIPEEFKPRMVVVNAHNPIYNNMQEGNDKEILNNTLKKLSGCTIAMLTMIASLNNFDSEHNGELILEQVYSVSDSVALTILSDVMDVSVIFNRWMFKLGMLRMNADDNLLFRSIRNGCTSARPITADDIRFNIVPIINSANRFHSEELLENLYLKSETHEEYEIAIKNLILLNSRRKSYTNDIVKLILSKEEEFKQHNGIVLSINTEYGINGLIAGKLKEMEQKPCVCFIHGDDGITLHGSCRSVENIDMLSILEKLKEENIVDHYGGHKQACGCSIKKENLSKFTNRFYELCPPKKDLNKLIKVDLVIEDNQVGYELANEIQELEPFGNGFEAPVIYSEFSLTQVFQLEKIAIMKSTVEPYVELGVKPDAPRTIKLVAFSTGRYDIRDVYKEMNRVGVAFVFKSGEVKPGLTPELKIEYGVKLDPNTEIFNLV